ncbi:MULTISPECIES: hypothetical protein [unclassified Paenibacillus]|uniref:hypothetical protein n=1 Tax=unclassified Paenibacillus TaxID=185978 RepID=UPI0008988F4C|nr:MULTISPECIES: hypothetical protein [unclassified Paenibacillus]OMC68609.1 hypothetical protein BK126_12335 [Paenibacillus sp. FSL H7-0326]SDW57361.1 hypothetical protein SAMN05518848_102228 [Paenibacillus sp. PDC88]
MQEQPKVAQYFNIRKNIIEMVKAFPEVKENYNDLVASYWVLYDNVKEMAEIRKATPAETITRQFRKLVELREITPPARVLEARQEKAREYRTEFSALGG